MRAEPIRDLLAREGRAFRAPVRGLKRKWFLGIALALTLVGLVAPASTTASPPGAKWVVYPTCTATSTTLTCTGSAVHIGDPYLLRAVVWTEVWYTCHGGVNDGIPFPSTKVTEAPMKNGKPFTITLVVDPTDASGFGDSHAEDCPGGSWLREDPNYYDVVVQAGISQGGAEFGGALFANLGTISP
jgi:hypothetical protein